MSDLLQLKSVTKSYGSVQVLHPLDLTVMRGEFVSLLGPSGCGKTTTLRLVAGLEEPSSGEIILDGRVVAGPVGFVPPEKRNLGMVFQSYAIWPHMTVFDNVAYPLKIRRVEKKKRQQRVETILGALKLDKLGARFPHELSGGQQQRVALGRALVMEPVMLLLDEPLSNLDAKLRVGMRAEIKNLQREFHTTVIYVTHDQDEAFAMSDRIVLMNAGRVEQNGTPQEFRTQPASEFVREFLH